MTGIRRFLAVLAALLLWGTGAQAEAQPFRRQTMDFFSTVCVLTIYPQSDAVGQAVWQEVKATLADIEQAVSVSNAESDVARFNALPCGGEIAVGNDTAAMLQIVMQVYEETDGVYDPTVYPLIDLWGFSPRFNESAYTPAKPYDRAYENGLLTLPEEKYINAFRSLVNLDGVTLSQREGQWFLRKDIAPVTVDGVTYQAMMDLGGIAKGYACDRVKEILAAYGIERGVFVCGESSISFLQSATEDGCYRVELGKPRTGDGQGSAYATLRTSDMSLSSSSDARHAYVLDGVRYCHLIDPRTGWPMNRPDASGVQQGVATATILGSCAAYDDAMTTALCVMGEEAAAAYIAAHPELPAVVVAYQSDRSELTVHTNLPPEALTVLDTAYQLAR